MNLKDTEQIIIKDKWIYLSLLVVCIIFLAILFRGCDKPISHKSEVKELQQQDKHIATNEAVYEAKIADLNDQYNASKRRADSLQKLVDKKVFSIQQKNIELSQQEADYQAAKAKNDVAAKDKACEEAIATAKAQSQECQEALAQKDSILAEKDHQLAIKDTTIANQQRLYSDMRSARDDYRTAYTGLNADYKKVSFKYKLEQVKTKGGTIIGAIVGASVAIIIKNNLRNN